MTRPRGTRAEDHLWPFDFMLQVAFTSSPHYLAEGTDANSYQDDKPWEFPGLGTAIMGSVDAGVSPAQRQIIEDMAEFTTLQRLFRLALGACPSNRH
jgi:hypothetical protein